MGGTKHLGAEALIKQTEEKASTQRVDGARTLLHGVRFQPAQDVQTKTRFKTSVARGAKIVLVATSLIGTMKRIMEETRCSRR